MNTTTHALVAIAGFQRKAVSKSAWAALVGSILPDAFIAVFLAVTVSQNLPFQQIWDVEYFREPWVTTGAIFNSFPLWLGLLVFGLFLNRNSSKVGKLITVGALSGLSHLVLDFFTHADDAHQHFWPISTWRFESPFSYWDVEHNATFVMPVEGAIGLLATQLLWPRTESRFLRGLLALMATLSLLLLLSPLLRILAD